MSDFFSQFHLLRPLWLLALLPALALLLALWRQRQQARQWQQLVAPELLPHLLDGNTSRTPARYLLALALAWLLAVIAMAGPSWEKRPVAIEKKQQALVIILDLSPSMLSEDIKPSRLTRARLKIIDILQRRQDGYTGLVAYAGDAHAVTPLSDDSKTIINLLPDLSPQIMPLSGSNTEAAVARALQMLRDGQASKGELLLLTDGVTEDAQASVIALMQQAPGISLSVLGIGGTQPAPIPSSKGGFVRDRDGSIVTTRLEPAQLRALAQQSRGRYQSFSDTPTDIDNLLTNNLLHANNTERSSQQNLHEFDSWYDRGHWLVLLLLPLVLYSFRRGLVLGLLGAPLLLLAIAPQPSYAFAWQDLWLNKNQQGQQALQQQQDSAAATLFNDPQWKASAHYRAGNYEAAAEGFAQDDSARGHYNRGNALAKAGKLDEAINAYDQALARSENFADAQRNRALVEAAKQQQEQQEQQQNPQGDSENSDSTENSDNTEKNGEPGSEQQTGEPDNTGDKSNTGDNSQGQQGEPSSPDNTNNPQKNDQENAEQAAGDASEPAPEGEALSEEEQAAEAQRQAEEEAQRQEEAAQRHAAEEAQRQAMEEASEAAQQEAAAQQQAAAEHAQATAPDDGLSDEERQAMEQWLRRVPDEPGLLLKNKFQDQYRKRRLQMYNGQWEAPDNGAAERW